ncbi:MAG: ABC transporter permease [Eubacterium sp.]|nr:ABC transporter permease [Eubacterium sp.]
MLKGVKIEKYNFTQGCIAVLILYFLSAGVFYYAAGEQLYIRESKNEIISVQGDSMTPEIIRGCSVRQDFVCRMDGITRFEVWGSASSGEDMGVIELTLFDQTADKQLYHSIVPAADFVAGQAFSGALEQEAFGVRGHAVSLVLASPDGESGSTAAFGYTQSGQMEEGQLYIKEEAVLGTLCFSVYGTDNVWTGPHYWKIVIPTGLLLALYCMVLIWKKKHGKKSLIITACTLLKRYSFLIRQLVSRDFKIKYKRSVLGVMWSFFNPLLTMGVQYIVFSKLFQRGVVNYPVYLLSGVVLFNFFSESSNVAMYAITGNANLIKKVYVPKYIYPLSKVLSTLVNLVIAMIPMILMTVGTGIHITKAWLLIPFVLICLLLFCLGVSLMLSAFLVFFRDIQFIWSVFLTAMNYITPIFYPESILPEPMLHLVKLNPMYNYIDFFRTIVIDGISPEPRSYALCFAISVIFLTIGVLIFRKMQDRFVFAI